MATRGENRFGTKRLGLLAPKYAPRGPSIGLEAKPQGSYGTGSEAGHLGSPSRRKPPQLDLSAFPEFQSIGSGWERLLPFDMDDICGWPKYLTYLEEFYSVNRNHAASVASIASQCLKMEEKLKSFCRDAKDCAAARLSSNIHQYMLHLVQDVGEPRSPFFKDAATCIAKVAELQSHWLSKGYHVSSDEYILSQCVRHWALNALIFEGNWCVDISAPLVGIRKEAEWMLENKSLGAPDTSMEIMEFAVDLVRDKLYELGRSKHLARGRCEITSDDNDGEMEVNGPMQGNPEKLTFGEYRHSTEGSCELDSGNLSSIIMKLAQDVVDETGVLSGPIWITPDLLGCFFGKNKLYKNNHQKNCVINKMKQPKLNKSLDTSCSSQRKVSGVNKSLDTSCLSQRKQSENSRRISAAVWR